MQIIKTCLKFRQRIFGLRMELEGVVDKSAEVAREFSLATGGGGAFGSLARFLDDAVAAAAFPAAKFR